MVHSLSIIAGVAVAYRFTITIIGGINMNGNFQPIADTRAKLFTSVEDFDKWLTKNGHLLLVDVKFSTTAETEDVLVLYKGEES